MDYDCQSAQAPVDSGGLSKSRPGRNLDVRDGHRADGPAFDVRDERKVSPWILAGLVPCPFTRADFIQESLTTVFTFWPCPSTSCTTITWIMMNLGDRRLTCTILIVDRENFYCQRHRRPECFHLLQGRSLRWFSWYFSLSHWCHADSQLKSNRPSDGRISIQPLPSLKFRASHQRQSPSGMGMLPDRGPVQGSISLGKVSTTRGAWCVMFVHKLISAIIRGAHCARRDKVTAHTSMPRLRKTRQKPRERQSTTRRTHSWHVSTTLHYITLRCLTVPHLFTFSPLHLFTSLLCHLFSPFYLYQLSLLRRLRPGMFRAGRARCRLNVLQHEGRSPGFHWNRGEMVTPSVRSWFPLRRPAQQRGSHF